MDFHGMKRKDLQTLCKKHGIPANLKNIEMATRLASVFQKETVTLPEDSVEADGIKDDVVVTKEAKRVRFSPQNEVFEFTRSVVEKCQRKNVRMSSQGHALQQGGIEIELMRSKRIVAKGITVARPVTKALEVPKRLKRIGSSGSTQKECKVSDFMALEQFEFEDISEGLEKIGRRSTRLKAKTLLSAKLVDSKNNEDELVKNNMKDVSMDVQVEKVSRRSSRFVNDINVQTNTQDRRWSIRLKARAANSSMGGETSDNGPLCSAKEGKKETKIKQLEGSKVVKSQEGKESLIDCEVQTTESYGRKKLHDVTKVEKVPRRSKRRMEDINVLMDKRPVKAAKREKSLSELIVDGQAQKGAKQPKRTFGNDREDKKLLRSSVIDCEPDGASVDNVKKSKVNDGMQVPVRFTRNSLRHDSSEAPKVVEGNLVEKKRDETLEKSGGTNVGSGGSSKKPKTVNQECVRDKPQGMIEISPSSSETKAAESVMVIENVLDSTPENPVDSSQRTNTQELNSELMEGKREEKLEHDMILMPVIEEDTEEVSSLSVLLIERLSPASVQLAISNPEAEVVVPTSHNLVKDIAEKNIKTKEKTLTSTPRSELKECSSVAKLAKAEEILENSAECWKEINPGKDDVFEYNTENNSAEEEMEITKNGYVSVVGPFVNLTPEKLLDEYSQPKPEEAGGANVETRSSSMQMKTGTHELVKDHPQGMAEKDSPSTSETKATEPVMTSENVLDSTLKSSVDIAPVRSTQELDSELLEEEREEKHEQDTVLMAAGKENVSENGKTPAADLVTHDKDEESHVVVFTTPRIVEAGKEEDDTSTNFPDESDAPNTNERYSMLEGSRQTEARNEGECKVIELHDESEIATSLVRKFSVEDSKGDRIRRNEESRIIELQHESGTCTSMERHELLGSFGQNKAIESVQFFYEGSGLSTGLHRDQPLADSELGEAGWQEINSVDKSGLFTNPKTQLVSGDLEQKKAVKTAEREDAEFCDVLNIPERRPFTENSELEEAAKSEEDKVVELQVDCGIFTSAEKHSNKENMNVDLLGESNTYNNPERHLLFGDSGVDETKKIKNHTATTCEESFVFTSPETQQILVNSEQHSNGKEEQNEVEFKDESAFFSKLESGLVLGESRQAGPDQIHHSSTPKFDFRENTIADSSGSMASKVSYNHEFNVGAELMKKGSQAEDVDSLDATQGKSKKDNEHSPHVDSVNLLDFDIEEAETIMEAERNVLCCSNILALPIEGNSEAAGKVSSYLEVAGTCSMVSEESVPSTDVQNQIHDAKEELALTDEFIDAKVTKTSKESYVLAGAEGEHLSLNSEVDFRNTCEKSVSKDEAADSIASAFEKAIALTSDELTVQNNMTDKAADEEMIRRETTSSPKETLHDSSENKEYLNIDESGEKQQVRREPILIYRTQVKLKRHDMKENAPNSKIVDNLNVTAPRTSKRQPLQDLRNN